MNAVEQQIAAVMPEIFEAEAPAVAHTAGGDIIPQGQRDATLAQFAGAMRRKGFSVEAIDAALAVENQHRCQPPLADFEVRKIARSIGRYPPRADAVPQTLIGYTLDDLATRTFPDRRPVFVRDGVVVFREGHLGEIYAPRGVGKTWFLTSLGLAAATGGEVLGFRAPHALNVLGIDGEMATLETKERYEVLGDRLGLSAPGPKLMIVAADWQDAYLPRLDTPEGQAAIEPFIEPADLILIDNRSCLFDPDSEKDASAWQPAQDWLLSLRRRGKGVLIAHHSNRQGGARGHSKPEDLMNLLINLTRPEDYSQDQGARFVVTFDKSRGAYGSAVAPFTAHLTQDGWQCERREGVQQERGVEHKLVTYMQLASAAGERPKSATAAISGARINRAAGLKAWADLLNRGVVLKHNEGGFYAR